jgi:hypothetical protein
MMQMKKFILLTVALCGLFCGCTEELAEPPANKEKSDMMTSDIIVKISVAETPATTTGDAPAEPVAFTGNDILWFNETTRELRFKDNQTMNVAFANRPGFSNSGVLKFYLGDEFLFTSLICINSADAPVYRSLVLYYNRNENRYFLLESYPPASNNPPSAADPPRDNNNHGSATAEWAKFINRLKQEGRHKN